MIDYTIFYKEELAVDEDWGARADWDIFISGYTAAERVQSTYQRVTAPDKHWLVFPEYGFAPDECPAQAFISDERDEADFVQTFWGSCVGEIGDRRIGIDITGFIRPYLMFLVKWLGENGVRRFDALYTEPVIYLKRELTRFSDEAVLEVRQVAGFEGTHNPETSNDYLIIGAGYDHELIAKVAENKAFSRKVQIFGLPSLRADMYQENVLRAYKAELAVGRHTSDQINSCFAPANDPFVTAETLRDIVGKLNARKPVTNLYLSPLATKPQVLGFALYYLTECRGGATSLIFPFCETYAQETSTGVARVWKYTVELPAF
jgi:hypothetical protein